MISQDNIKSLVGNHVAPYIYNANHFEAGKTPIYYSGPYWDNREIEAAIDSFLNGKWITSGEKVFMFEKYSLSPAMSDINILKKVKMIKNINNTNILTLSENRLNSK